MAHDFLLLLANIYHLINLVAKNYGTLKNPHTTRKEKVKNI